MTTGSRTNRRLRTPASSVWRTIAVSAVADKVTIVGVLAFYGLAIAVGVGALWPPLQDTFKAIADEFPPAFDAMLGGLSIATPAGWMNAELLSMVGPGFLIAVAMISAASATAGEEQGRTLSLVLSTGIRRNTFLAAKAAAMVVHVLTVGAALFAGMLIANPVGNLGLPVPDLLAATANMTLVGLLAGAIALTLGAMTGDKRLTLAVTGGLFGVSFILANFLGLKESLVWLSKLNFWYPYLANPVLADGMDWHFAAILAGLAVGIGAIGFVVFARRGDLRG